VGRAEVGLGEVRSYDSYPFHDRLIASNSDHQQCRASRVASRFRLRVLQRQPDADQPLLRPIERGRPCGDLTAVAVWERAASLANDPAQRAHLARRATAAEQGVIL
jgi:hypothetical protein